jgi:hypothetical protein
MVQQLKQPARTKLRPSIRDERHQPGRWEQVRDIAGIGTLYVVILPAPIWSGQNQVILTRPQRPPDPKETLKKAGRRPRRILTSLEPGEHWNVAGTASRTRGQTGSGHLCTHAGGSDQGDDTASAHGKPLSPDVFRHRRGRVGLDTLLPLIRRPERPSGHLLGLEKPEVHEDYRDPEGRHLPSPRETVGELVITVCAQAPATYCPAKAVVRLGNRPADLCVVLGIPRRLPRGVQFGSVGLRFNENEAVGSAIEPAGADDVPVGRVCSFRDPQPPARQLLAYFGG